MVVYQQQGVYCLADLCWETHESSSHHEVKDATLEDPGPVCLGAALLSDE